MNAKQTNRTAVIPIGLIALSLWGTPSALRGDPGVSASELVIGQPAAFSGPSAGLGVELWRGMEAALREVNQNSGVHGRTVRAVLCDDRYSPEGASSCTRQLVQKDGVFLLANSVGTPTIVRIIPFLHAWSAKNVMLFGNFTGAQSQRSMPYAPYVYNIRASYHQETAAHVEACLAEGRRNVGTFVQNDAYGKDGEEGVRIALAGSGLEQAAKTYYERGATYDEDMGAQVALLREAGVDCISTTGSYQGVGAFIRAARQSGWDVPIYGVSFTGADQMLEFLTRTEKATKARITDGVMLTQVVPHPEDTGIALVAKYRAAIDRHNPTLPPAPFDRGAYEPAKPYSFGSLEGYLNTVVLLEILQNAGRDITRAGFREAADSLQNLDVGLGADSSISFGAVTGKTDCGNHQALHRVWLTTIRNGRWVGVR